MNYIRDKNGDVIQSSRNLRGIKGYVSKNLIKQMDISEISEGEGKLSILFENGASYETNFAGYSVLRDHVRRWQNVYGAKLSVNGADCGIVEKDNPSLI